MNVYNTGMKLMTNDELNILILNNPFNFGRMIKCQYYNTYYYINNNYTGINFSEKLYRHLNIHINNIGICPSCGKPCSFRNMKKGFNNRCSALCHNQAIEIKKLKEKSALTKYGGKTPMESPMLKDKIKNTNLIRYGVENIFQSKELMKYSNENKNYDEISTKTKQTNLDKYGVSCILASEQCQEKMLLDKRIRMLDSIFRGNRLGGKATPMFSEGEYIDVQTYYKWNCNICNSAFVDNLDGGMFPRCMVCYPAYASENETNFLNLIDIPLRNYRIPEWKQKAVDGYDKVTNTIYEFLGDYWHGNPSKFKHDDLNPTNGDLFGKLYNDTFKHFKKLKSYGYNVKYIWETDWKTWIKNNKQGDIPMLKYINS